MTPLVEQFQKWLAQKPPEPSVMAPVGSRARLASDTEEERRSRMEILQALGMLPIPGANALQVAGELAGEAEITPRGVAKAVASGIMPVRGGPTKMSVMGEASRVNPAKLLRIQRALKEGQPAHEVYGKENALPMLREGVPGVQDAWTPVMPPKPRLAPGLEKKFSEFRDTPELSPEDYIKTTYGGLFHPQDLRSLEKHYPELLAKEVRIFANTPSGKGRSLPSHTEIDTWITHPEAPYSIQSIAAHEGTHDVADIAGLAPGYSARTVRKDLTDQREIARELAQSYRDVGQPIDADAITNAMNKTLVIPPGLSPLPAPYDKAGPEVQALARALAWQERLQNMPGGNASFKLYRAYHGEQAAEGARRYASGLKPEFTTPLSKQILKSGALADQDYAKRLQLLHAMKEAKLFDPLAQPYELPAAFHDIPLP